MKDIIRSYKRGLITKDQAIIQIEDLLVVSKEEAEKIFEEQAK